MKTFVFLCVFVPCSYVAAAQPAMLHTGSLEEMVSSVLEERRSLYIHLPDGYARSNDRYPVLYVLDAEWNFRKVVGIVDHLSASRRIPPMIVVGVPNRLRAGRISRFTDLAPAHAERTESAGAQRFLRFVAEELIPFVDERYRTAPHRTLLGHSLGGLFAVFALLEKPEAFTGFIAISPSLGRNSQQQVKNAAVRFGASFPRNKNLQLFLGNEGGNTQLGTESFVAVLKENAPAGLQWQFRHLAHEDHVSVYHQSAYEALESIFDGWFIPEEYLTDHDISVVERHYASLSERLGFEVPVPELYYLQLGYRILATRDFEYGRWTFGRYVEVFPHSAAAWVGLGDVQLMAGTFEEARISYQKALEVDPSNERAEIMNQALKSH